MPALGGHAVPLTVTYSPLTLPPRGEAMCTDGSFGFGFDVAALGGSLIVDDVVDVELPQAVMPSARTSAAVRAWTDRTCGPSHDGAAVSSRVLVQIGGSTGAFAGAHRP